jgi:hypothetical protein
MAISAVVAAAVLAVGQQVDPHDFEVNVDYKPDLAIAALPTCTPAGVCTSEFTYSESGRSLSGTGRRISTGQEGTFRTTCDWSLPLRAVFVPKGIAVEEFRELSGSGSQACSWAIQLASGTLSGDMSGAVAVSLAGPLTALYEAMMTVRVVGGTGEFAGLVGGGTYTHSQEVPLSAPSGRSLAAAAGSQLDLTLRKGKPAARVWATDALRIVTVAGSSCRTTARKGRKTVRLGSARDGDRDGLVLVLGKLRPRLTLGRWTIKSVCTHATARAVVTVS